MSWTFNYDSGYDTLYTVYRGEITSSSRLVDISSVDTTRVRTNPHTFSSNQFGSNLVVLNDGYTISAARIKTSDGATLLEVESGQTGQIGSTGSGVIQLGVNYTIADGTTVGVAMAVSTSSSEHIYYFEFDITGGGTTYTVTLNLTNCTADQDTSVSVVEGGSYTVNLTADSGYYWETLPTTTVGGSTVTATSVSDTVCQFSFDNITENISISASATVEPPTEYQIKFVDDIYTYNEAKSVATTTLPTGWMLVDNTGVEVDVSRLNYVKGDAAPTDLYITPRDNYDYSFMDGLTVYIYFGSNTYTGRYTFDTSSKPSIYLSDLLPSTFPDAQGIFIFLSTLSATVTTYTVTLNLYNCSADKTTVTEVTEGSSYSVVLTANSGYEWKTLPTTTVGGSTVTATSISSTQCSFTFDSVGENISITASAEESGEEPVVTVDSYPFVRVYNPTTAQMIEAGNALFLNLETAEYVNVDNYVVSLKRVFVTPVCADDLEVIKFGKYTTSVYSRAVIETVVNFDFGSVTVEEIYNSAADYSPYTSAKIWLPFIGFMDVSVNLIMGKTVKINYKVDLITGNAVAEITVGSHVLYRATCTAYEADPYYFNNGGTLTKEVINSAYNMSSKRPYIILERSTKLGDIGNDLEVYSTYKEDIIGNFNGFIRCRRVWVNGIDASDEERTEIEGLLTSGVLVN